MNPPEINFNICLISPSELDDPVIKHWFKCVSEKSPYGVPATLALVDDKGEPQTVALIHRETDDGHKYVVPLSRDLTEKEAERIIECFEKRYPDLDFEVEATVIPTYTMDNIQPTISVDQHKYAEVAKLWSKRKHETWMKKREKEGWRYGTEVSHSEKTHPLMRPWEQLPEEYRSIDEEQPQELLDLLGEQGFAVISKDDLEAVMRVIRATK